MPVPWPVTASTGAPGEDRRERARGGRVADPHLADPEEVETGRIARRSATTRRPVAIARERLVAGHGRSSVMSAVPARTRALTSVPPRTGSGATSGIGPATPASTTTTRAPTVRGEDVDRRPAGRRSWRPSGRSPRPGRPRRHGARRRDRRRPRRSPGRRPDASARPVIPASWMASASSRPRLPGGLVSRSRRAAAAAIASASSGPIARARAGSEASPRRRRWRSVRHGRDRP